LREAVGYEECYGYLIHDRDSIFAKSLDESIARLGTTVLRSPFQSPKATATCERVIGTIRRECLDWMIPLSESHLRLILKSWVNHYNWARAHVARAWRSGSTGDAMVGPAPELPARCDPWPCRARQINIGRVASRIFISGGAATLLGLNFLDQGVRRGQRCLYFGFCESPARLLGKAFQLGMTLSHGQEQWVEFPDVPNEESLRCVMSERIAISDELYYPPLDMKVT
jgi:hypothetical protein